VIGRIVQVLQGQIGFLASIAISFLQSLPTDHLTRSAVIQKTFRVPFCATLSPHSQGLSPGIPVDACLWGTQSSCCKMFLLVPGFRGALTFLAGRNSQSFFRPIDSSRPKRRSSSRRSPRCLRKTQPSLRSS
jgi:hypothetical protein